MACLSITVHINATKSAVLTRTSDNALVTFTNCFNKSNYGLSLWISPQGPPSVEVLNLNSKSDVIAIHIPTAVKPVLHLP
jgi:hypothetical protein